MNKMITSYLRQFKMEINHSTFINTTKTFWHLTSTALWVVQKTSGKTLPHHQKTKLLIHSLPRMEN